MVKKIILISLGVCLLAFGGLTAYIATMDWNPHKAEIAKKISEMTGKRIEFSGNISVSLLPHPSMTAHNINIYSDTSEKLATVELMETAVSLLSLLKGQPDIESLSFINPEIWIKVENNGKLNWHGGDKGLSEEAQKTSMQSFNMQNATIHYEDAKQGSSMMLSQVNADVQATTLAGPYRMDGSFTKDDDQFGIAVMVGSIAQFEDVSLNIAITHPRSESHLRYDGTYNMNNGQIKGDLSGGSQKTAELVNILSGENLMEEEFNKDLQFSVGVETDEEEIRLSSFIIKYGEFIEGSGNLIIPRNSTATDRKAAEVNYQLVNLDVRPIVSVLKAEYAKFKENGNIYKPDTEMDVLVDVSAERIIFNDSMNGYFENLTVKGDWRDNVLNLDEFYASAPGNMIVNVSGSLLEDNTRPKYFVKTSLIGQDLTAFLGALEISVTPQVQSTYRNIDMSFSVLGNNQGFVANDIKLVMDKMNIVAAVQAKFTDNKTDYTIRFNADTLNLDNYLPKKETEGVVNNIKEYTNDLAFLNDINLKGRIDVGRLTFRGVPVNDVVLKIENTGGKLKIEEAKTTNVLDTEAEIKGIFSGFGSQDLKIDNLEYKVATKNPQDLLDKLQLPLPDWKIFQAKNLQLIGRLSGNMRQATVKLQSSNDQARFTYNGTVEQTQKEFLFAGTADLRTTNFSDFVNGIGGTVPNNASTRGALNCQGKIRGSSLSWQFGNASCMLGVAKYTGNLAVKKNKNTYNIKAVLETNELNLENVITPFAVKNVAGNKLFEENFIARPVLNKDSINFKAYENYVLDINLSSARAVYKTNTYDNFKVHLLNGQNIMRFNDMSFGYYGVKIAGNAEVNYAETPVVKGKAAVQNVDLGRIGGLVYMITQGLTNFEADFSGPATSIEDLINNISGNITFSVTDFAFKGIDLAKIAADLQERKYSKGVFQMVRDNLQSGKTAFEPFEGTIGMKDGLLTFQQLQLKNSDAQLVMDGKFNLNDWKMSTNFATKMLKVENQPQFTFTLSGLISKPVLDVNVESIVRKYDQHWEQVAEAQEAEKAAAEKRLNDSMDDAQSGVTALSEQLNSYVPVIEGYKTKVDDKASLAWYDEKLSRIAAINKELDQMQGKARIAGFTAEDIGKINEECAHYTEELGALKKDVEARYDDDVRQQLEQAKSVTDKINEDSQALFDDYQKMVQDNFDILLQIKATQYMINNAELKMQQSEITRLNDEMADIYLVAEKHYNQTSYIKVRTELENKVIALRDNGEQMRDVYAQMEKTRNTSAALLLQIINEQKKLYEEEQKKKEDARKAREREQVEGEWDNNDAGDSVNADETSQDELLSQDNLLSEENDLISGQVSGENKSKIIVKSDNALPNEERSSAASGASSGSPTLRSISDDTVSTISGKITTSYSQEQAQDKKSGSGFLKAVDGDTQQPSGTIVVK